MIAFKSLAMEYSPCVTAKSASRTLMRWIVRNTSLWEELQACGYSMGSRLLTPVQVRLIKHYLGEP